MAWQIASLASSGVSYFASLRFSEQLAPMFGQQAPLNKFRRHAGDLCRFIIFSFGPHSDSCLVRSTKVRLDIVDKQFSPAQ